jgi:hypothetical protein
MRSDANPTPGDLGRPSRALSLALVFVSLVLVLSPVPVSATSWGPVMKISGGGAALASPGAIAMAGSSTIGVAWVEEGTDHRFRLYFRRSTDGGQTWGIRILISQSGHALNASLAGAGSRFDLVWNQVDDARERTTAWYVRSIDAGASWGTPLALSPPIENASVPSVARDSSGTVAVVWEGGNPMLPPFVWARVSSNGGRTFGAKQALDEVAHDASPKVAVGLDGKVHVVYNRGFFNLWYQSSSDAGQHWTAPERVARDIELTSIPAIAAAGRTVIIGYTQLVDGPERWVKYRRSTDNGATWELPRQLARRDAKNTLQPVFSVRNGRWRAVFIKCQTATCDEATVHLRVSLDKGVTWSSPRLVSPDVDAGNSPVGADGGKRTVVAWSRYDENGLNGRVFTRRSN